MAIKYDNVIIFGPTGETGRAAAAEAGKRGAKVWLAMRDPKKTIPNLDETSGKYERIQADLSDPASVKSAVEKSGAKAAYTYMLHGNQDGMKATIGAMKDGGIEYVVFLSSFTIFPEEDPRDVAKERIIPYFHAVVEVTIEDSGLAATFLRPGAFAYNTFAQNTVNRSSEPWIATLAKSDNAQTDGIVPRDIGRVGGAVLVDRPSEDKKHIIYLYGPERLSRKKHLEIAKKVTGKDVQINEVDDETYIKETTKTGVPEFIVRYLLQADGGKLNDRYYGEGRHEEGVANVKKYSGTEATTFEQFCKEYFSK